jgi:hydroxymethylpyrimidine kinase/phosphomethylpyrimidine kinase
MTPVVASVGTTHPFLAAGLLLEMFAIRSLGARPLAIVAGVSAQDAGHVLARTAIDATTIAAQFRALAKTPIAAFCVGALPSPKAVTAVAEQLRNHAGVPVICDPVVAASGGDRLVDDATLVAMRAHLFPCCTLLTPNLAEAELLTGQQIDGPDAMRAALPALLALGSRSVLLKGGHLAGDPLDLFADGEQIVELRASRLRDDLRGTGSLLAAAIATHCAFGDPLLEAIASAREFVRERIVEGVAFGGMRIAF